MASIGMAVYEGRKMDIDERKRIEESRRYLAERALFDETLAEKEKDLALVKTKKEVARRADTALQKHAEGMRKGDSNSYVQYMNELYSPTGSQFKLETRKGKDVVVQYNANGKEVTVEQAPRGDQAIAMAQKHAMLTDDTANQYRGQVTDVVNRQRTLEDMNFKRNSDLMLQRMKSGTDLQVAGINSAGSNLKNIKDLSDFISSTAAEQTLGLGVVKDKQTGQWRKGDEVFVPTAEQEQAYNNRVNTMFSQYTQTAPAIGALSRQQAGQNLMDVAGPQVPLQQVRGLTPNLGEVSKFAIMARDAQVANAARVQVQQQNMLNRAAAQGMLEQLAPMTGEGYLPMGYGVTPFIPSN